jgi:hypothetical protein
MLLRVCAGGVSIEQRSRKGASTAARLRSTGAASAAVADAKKLRRDHDRFMLFSSSLGWFAAGHGNMRWTPVRPHGSLEPASGSPRQCEPSGG